MSSITSVATYLYYSYSDEVLGVFDSELMAKAVAYDLVKKGYRSETPEIVVVNLNEVRE